MLTVCQMVPTESARRKLASLRIRQAAVELATLSWRAAASRSPQSTIPHRARFAVLVTIVSLRARLMRLRVGAGMKFLVNLWGGVP